MRSFPWSFAGVSMMDFPMNNDSNSRPQFRLATLMLVVLGCSLVLGVIANLETQHRVSIESRTSPERHVELAQWYQNQPGVREVRVWPGKGDVNVEYVTSWTNFRMITPPLEELGYRGMIRISARSSSGIPGWVFRALGKIPMEFWVILAIAIPVILGAQLVRLIRTAGRAQQCK
jgi:hypothetical protein